jgi:hypothetical protein
MIRKLFVGATLAGLMTLGVGTVVRSANAQDPGDKQEQQASKTVSGKVASIGNGGHSFSLEVTGESKSKMDFVVDKNTQVNGQVREGSSVTVQYQAMANGQNLAVSITANA